MDPMLLKAVIALAPGGVAEVVSDGATWQSLR